MTIALLLCKIDWTDPTLLAGIISVIGTLLGTFAGYFLSQWSKRGSIKFLCNRIDLEYNFESDKGTGVRYHRTMEFNGQKAKSTRIKLELYLLNSSDVQFSINNPKLVVKYKNVTYRSNLHIEQDEIHSRKNYETLLLKGKESMHTSAHTSLDFPIGSKELDEMNFYVKFIDIKGNTKCKKIKISKTLTIGIN